MDSTSHPSSDPHPLTPQPVFADVVVPRRLTTAFTYVIPDRLRERVQVGSRVRVPLGPATVQGLIVSLSHTSLWEGTCGIRKGARPAFREIAELLDDERGFEADRALLELAKQVSEHYLTPLGQCLRLILPPIRHSRGSLSFPTTVIADTKAPAAPSVHVSSAPLMNGERPPWWTTFLDALNRSTHEAFLWTVPSAHRRKGLLEALATVRACGRSALILAPDLATAQLMFSEIQARWPNEAVLLYGGLKAAVYAETWQRIRAGGAPLVVGTRSTVFAPVADLGLIWIDDEQDELFKEEQAPHYHAREVAWMRARQQSSVLVLGSASPSLEAWWAFSQKSQPLALNSSHRQDTASRPIVQLIDLRAYPPGTLLTEPLVTAIRDCLARRAGVLLFVNRKGFASALLCRECGGSLSCESCRVPLTYFRQAARLLCRWCGATTALPEVCPACQSTKLEPIGTGTERLEEHIRRLFPDIRIARLDREAAQTSARAEAVRRLFALGELDLLIGTKLLFTGPPPPAVGLIGIIYADALLHRPDFRAAERTFHAMARAVEAAVSGPTPGQVLIQTALPSHHVYAALATGDLSRFYDQELAFRQVLNYPPQACVIRLSVAGPQEAEAQGLAERWAETIRQLQLKQDALRPVTLLGPMPAVPPYLRKRYRWQLLVKAEQREAACLAVRLSLDELQKKRRKSGLKLDVTVDPLEI